MAHFLVQKNEMKNVKRRLKVIFLIRGNVRSSLSDSKELKLSKAQTEFVKGHTG